MKEEIIGDESHKKELMWCQQVYRESGKYVSKFFYKLPFSANQITFFTFIFTLFGLIAIILGNNYVFLLIGVFLMQLGVVLDYVDGEIARYKGQSSIFGNWLDCTLDRVDDVLILFGYGIYVIRNHSPFFDGFFINYSLEPLIAWIIIISIVMIFRFLIDNSYSYTLLYVPDAKKYYKEGKQSILRNFFYSRVNYVCFYPLPFIILNLLDYYMIFLAGFSILWYIAMLFVLAVRVYNGEKSKKEN